MEPQGKIDTLERRLEENTRLVEENNKLLRKVYRNAKIGLWITVTWYVLLIGLPFALYFYVLEPYFTALGSSYETFSTGMQELPGWKMFNEYMTAWEASRGE